MGCIPIAVAMCRGFAGKAGRCDAFKPGNMGEEVEASVARCLRTPPDSANRQEFKVKLSHRLRGETCFRIVVVCNYKNGPITVATMPSENTVFTPSSILFRPRRGPSWPLQLRSRPSRNLVEAPGTAPGSDRFITQAIYRHSRQAGTPNIGTIGGHSKPLKLTAPVNRGVTGGKSGRKPRSAKIHPVHDVGLLGQDDLMSYGAKGAS